MLGSIEFLNSEHSSWLLECRAHPAELTACMTASLNGAAACQPHQTNRAHTNGYTPMAHQHAPDLRVSTLATAAHKTQPGGMQTRRKSRTSCSLSGRRGTPMTASSTCAIWACGTALAALLTSDCNQERACWLVTNWAPCQGTKHHDSNLWLHAAHACMWGPVTSALAEHPAVGCRWTCFAADAWETCGGGGTCPHMYTRTACSHRLELIPMYCELRASPAGQPTAGKLPLLGAVLLRVLRSVYVLVGLSHTAAPWGSCWPSAVLFPAQGVLRAVVMRLSACVCRSCCVR